MSGEGFRDACPIPVQIVSLGSSCNAMSRYPILLTPSGPSDRARTRPGAPSGSSQELPEECAAGR